MTLDRFEGTLLGLALGEAFGLPHVGARPGTLERPSDLAQPPGRLPRGQYGAGTQGALAVTQSLIERGAFDGKSVANAIAALFRDNRIIGRADQDREAVNRLTTGTADWTASGAPVGRVSFTPALRAIPLGLLYAGDRAQLRKACVDLARITHKDPRSAALAVGGAAAVAELVTSDTIEPMTYASNIADAVRPVDGVTADALLDVGRWAEDRDDLTALAAASAALEKGVPRPDSGEGVRGPRVLVSALVAFFRGGDDYLTCMGAALKAGGDTDQTAGLAGALTGAYGGLGALPRHQSELATDRGERGYDEILDLARNLHALQSRGG